MERSEGRVLVGLSVSYPLNNEAKGTWGRAVIGRETVSCCYVF